MESTFQVASILFHVEAIVKVDFTAYLVSVSDTLTWQ